MGKLENKNKWMVGSDYLRRTNKGTTTTPDSPINTKQCIVMTQDYSGDNIVIKLYIDGEKVDEYTSPNKLHTKQIHGEFILDQDIQIRTY